MIFLCFVGVSRTPVTQKRDGVEFPSLKSTYYSILGNDRKRDVWSPIFYQSPQSIFASHEHFCEISIGS